jgi:putative transposase
MKHRKDLVSARILKLSIRTQCELLSVPRSTLYYQPLPEKPENVKMMNIMDKQNSIDFVT